MRKLAQRLFMLTLTVIALIALTSSSSTSITPIVAAGENDCQVVSQVCHDINAGLYLLCVNQTGDYTGCALTEAQNNISCITGAGCPYNH